MFLIVFFKKILKQLPVQQILQCKSVNKRWCAVLNNLKFQKLALIDDETVKKTWFWDFSPIQHQTVIIDLTKFNPFDFKYQNEHHLLRLKKLYLHSLTTSDTRTDYSLNDLIRSLTSLEQLELHGIKKKDEEIIIKSNSLNTFHTDSCVFKRLELDTPNLFNIRTGGYWQCNFIVKYPKNVKVFYTEKISSHDIEEYSNLEYLFIEHIYSGFWSILEELPRLKELHFESSSTWHNYECVLDSKKETNNKIFKPFLFGINFKELKPHLNCKSFYAADRDNFRLYKDHSDSLANHLVFINSLNYNDFEDTFEEIPMTLAKKFVNLEKIIINGKVHKVNQLIKLLDCLSNIVTVLHIESSSLKQEFFDQLPQLIPILDFLAIKNEKKELNFDFLQNFKSIKSINLDQNVEPEILHTICSTFSKTLRMVNCREKNKNTIRIVRDFKKQLRIYKTAIKRPLDFIPNSHKDYGLNELFGSNSSLESLEIDTLF